MFYVLTLNQTFVQVFLSIKNSIYSRKWNKLFLYINIVILLYEFIHIIHPYYQIGLSEMYVPEQN